MEVKQESWQETELRLRLLRRLNEADRQRREALEDYLRASGALRQVPA